jgi:hypothetical protein
MLISVTGPHDMKLPLQGLPRPLMLKLHREQVIGIGLAAQAMAPDLHTFNEWLAEVLQDERLQPPGRFQVLLYQHVRALFTGRTESAEIQPDAHMTVLALRYWMISAGTARPPDLGEHQAFQQRIVSEALRTEPSQLSIPRRQSFTGRSPRSLTRASTTQSSADRTSWQSQADLYPGVPSRSLLRASCCSCRSCTPDIQSNVADGTTRGSLGTWASRKACTYARSWSIRART